MIKTLVMLVFIAILLSSCASSEAIEEQKEEYEEIISYYEDMCDELGLLSYESVYSPEKWHYYYSHNDGVYHLDWLCPEFNDEDVYLVGTKPGKFQPCEICAKDEKLKVYFLDTEERILHKKSHAKLGTYNYKSPIVNYRFVTKERAEEAGYEICSECFK